MDLEGGGDVFGALFAEELGLILEVAPEREAAVLAAYRDAGSFSLPQLSYIIGKSKTVIWVLAQSAGSVKGRRAAPFYVSRIGLRRSRSQKNYKNTKIIVFINII